MDFEKFEAITLANTYQQRGTLEKTIEMTGSNASYQAIIENTAVETIAEVYDLVKLAKTLNTEYIFRRINEIKKIEPYARIIIHGELYDTLYYAAKIAKGHFINNNKCSRKLILISNINTLTYIKNNIYSFTELSEDDNIDKEIKEHAKYLKDNFTDIKENKAGLIEVRSSTDIEKRAEFIYRTL